MRNHAILSVFAMLFLFACKGAEKGNGEGIVIDIDPYKLQKHTICELIGIDSVLFIKLETTDLSLIRYVDRVYFDNNKLIVVDIWEHQVLIFHEDGTFINKIRNRGQGPGEYLGMRTGLYDPVDKKIIVFGAKKLLIYALDGTLIKEILGFSNNANVREVFNLPNGNFLCHTYDHTLEQVGKQASGLWEVDTNGNFVRSIFTIDEIYPVLHNMINPHFQLLPDGRILFRDARFNDLYYLEDGKLTKFISYRLKGDIAPQFKGHTYVEGEKIIHRLLTVQANKNLIFTYWMELVTSRGFYTIYNEETGENVLINPAADLWQSENIVKPVHPVIIDNNRFDILITILSGEIILDYLNAKNSNPDLKNKLRELIKGMSESEVIGMNPVLQLLYLKN